MCYTAIYPTTAKSANANPDLLRITRIFNRWLKMIADYGKLDRLDIEKNFTAIVEVIKRCDIAKNIKKAIKRCRVMHLPNF